jgi:hypothetical protein
MDLQTHREEMAALPQQHANPYALSRCYPDKPMVYVQAFLS